MKTLHSIPKEEVALVFPPHWELGLQHFLASGDDYRARLYIKENMVVNITVNAGYNRDYNLLNTPGNMIGWEAFYSPGQSRFNQPLNWARIEKRYEDLT